VEFRVQRSQVVPGVEVVVVPAHTHGEEKVRELWLNRKSLVQGLFGVVGVVGGQSKSSIVTRSPLRNMGSDSGSLISFSGSAPTTCLSKHSS
jgi:hypothetical protein